MVFIDKKKLYISSHFHKTIIPRIESLIKKRYRF